MKAFDFDPLIEFLRDNIPEAIQGDWLDVSLHVQREWDLDELAISRVFIKSLGESCAALIDVHFEHPIWPVVEAFAAAFEGENEAWQMLRLRYLSDGSFDYDALDPAYYGWA